MYIPSCIKPLVLVNRAAINLLNLGFPLYINGSLYKSSFSVDSLLSLCKGKPESFFESSFVLRGEYKEFLYMLAPCGRCELCRNRKSVDFIFRCNMESQCYDCPPYFFTLTYSNKYLPPHSELRYSDIQKFFKRLRRSWDYRGIKHNIRYVVACEYGSNPHRSHRPHYHIILWNNPYNASELTPKLHNQLKDDIFSAWSMCELQSFDFGQCANGAAGYVAKYIRKEKKLYGHYTPMSIHTSISGGGIGSPLISSKLSYYRNNPSLRVFRYFDKFNNRMVSVNFGNYITTHLFPSPSRLIPPKVRDSYQRFCDTLTLLFSLGCLSLSQCHEYSELMRPYKNVLPNLFFPERVRLLSPCPTRYLFLRSRLIALLDEYANDVLVDYKDVLIDSSYLELYYKFRSLHPDIKREDTGFRLLELRQKDAVKTEREIF